MTKPLSWCASLIVVALGLAPPAAAQPPAGVPQQLERLLTEVAELREAAARQAEALEPRRFYLTQDTFDGSQPLNACAVGFHMASLWEIFDVTSLKYDRTLGFTQADSGEGPPVEKDGWIRTGSPSSASPIPNAAEPPNCNAYTSSQAFVGSSVYLSGAWHSRLESHPESPLLLPTPFDTQPWRHGNRLCESRTRVWCVQDR
jgi:hypothetical protein